MKRYRFTSAALIELSEAVLFYETRETGLGATFLNEVEACISRIKQNPTAWHQVSERTRRCRTHPFPFGLFYQIRTHEILIVFSDGSPSRSSAMAGSEVTGEALK